MANQHPKIFKDREDFNGRCEGILLVEDGDHFYQEGDAEKNQIFNRKYLEYMLCENVVTDEMGGLRIVVNDSSTEIREIGAALDLLGIEIGMGETTFERMDRKFPDCETWLETEFHIEARGRALGFKKKPHEDSGWRYVSDFLLAFLHFKVESVTCVKVLDHKLHENTRYAPFKMDKDRFEYMLKALAWESRNYRRND